MPEVNGVVTEWARKHTPLLLVIGTILCLGGGILYERHHSDGMILNGHTFTVETADTPSSRQQGLSGRESLGDNQAMLFVFDTPSEYCFWMKDMRFSIDIVWLNEDNTVAAIEQRVQPDTYPKNYCHNGLQVVELAAGTVERIGLQIGNQVSL